MDRILLLAVTVACAVIGVGDGLGHHWWRLGCWGLLAGLGALGLRSRHRAARRAPALDLSERLRTQVNDLLMAGRRTQAIRLVRRETGATLLGAARAVDQVTRRAPAARDGHA